MSDIKYKTLRSVLDEGLFTIPNYQRGYSWKEKHLEDLWKDINRLYKRIYHKKGDKKKENFYHYTGSLLVTCVDENKYPLIWKEKWWGGMSSLKVYDIVDGQQRLTSILIFLLTLYERGNKSKYVLKNPANGQPLQGEYIGFGLNLFIMNDDEKKFKLSYYSENPLNEYLTKTIFQDIPTTVQASVYAEKLDMAKKFWRTKVDSHIDTEDKFQAYCQLIMNHLKFDFREIDSELNTHMIFETVNSRGKALSNLEKLKNRLLYLCSLKTQVAASGDEKVNSTIKVVNSSWTKIYELLGKHPRLFETDDALLNNHWIATDSFSKEKEPYKKALFDVIFDVDKNFPAELDFPTGGSEMIDKISHYALSLKRAAKFWYLIRHPEDAWNDKDREILFPNYSKEIFVRLKRIIDLQNSNFTPFFLANFMAIEEERDLNGLDGALKYLKILEAFTLLIYKVSGRRSFTGRSHFRNLASHYYNCRISMDNLNSKSFKERRANDIDQHMTKVISDWVIPPDGYLRYDQLKLSLEEHFRNESGYESYNKLSHILSRFYYEEKVSGLEKLNLAENGEAVQLYNEQDLHDANWKAANKSIKAHYSLGNYYYLTGDKLKEFRSALSIEEKKAILAKVGYEDIIDCTKEDFAKRGIKIWKYILLNAYADEGQELDIDFAKDDEKLRGLLFLDR